MTDTRSASAIGGDHGDCDVELHALVDALSDDLSGHSDEALRRLLIGLHHLRDRAEGTICAAIGIFDRRGLGATDGSRTTATWVAARCEVTRTQASHDVRLGVALASLPVVAAAFRGGVIGRAKALALEAIRTPELVDVVAAEEAFLVDQIAGLGVIEAERWLRSWHQQARLMVGFTDPDDPVDTTEPRIAADLTRTFQDRWVLDAEMDGEHGRTMQTVIGAEVDEMFRTGVFSSDDGLTPAERRGQALFNLVTRKALRKWRHGAPVPSVEVIVDERTLKGVPIQGEEDLRSRVCRYSDGEPLSWATMSRYLCGARIHRLVIDAKGEVLDAGKDIRLANRGQRRALKFRHARRCAFPGCDAPADWTEAHHIEGWDPDPGNPRGGTNIGELVPLCRYHHHQVHEGGFLLVLEPDGQITGLPTTRPRHRPTTTHHTHPPPPSRHRTRRTVRLTRVASAQRRAGRHQGSA